MVNAVYSCKVARVDSQDGCPLQPGSTLNKTVMLKPLAQNCQAIRGLCMDAALSKVQAFLFCQNVVKAMFSFRLLTSPTLPPPPWRRAGTARTCWVS